MRTCTAPFLGCTSTVLLRSLIVVPFVVWCVSGTVRSYGKIYRIGWRTDRGIQNSVYFSESTAGTSPVLYRGNLGVAVGTFGNAYTILRLFVCRRQSSRVPRGYYEYCARLTGCTRLNSLVKKFRIQQRRTKSGIEQQIFLSGKGRADPIVTEQQLCYRRLVLQLVVK